MSKEVSESNKKLAIVLCLVEQLSAWDLELMEGIDSEIELIDGTKLVISMKQVQP